MFQGYLSEHGGAIGLVAIGGALGATLRFGTGAIAGEALLVTLLINAIGSFGLGCLLFEARAEELLSQRFRYLFGSGFFASFTTYSTFIADIALHAPELAIAYGLASYGAGFGGVLASRELIRLHSRASLAPTNGGKR